jgi:hypothetical protein
MVRRHPLLAENDQTHLADADIFTPEKVLNNGIVRRYLDFSQPIALFQCGTLHHYNGERAPSDIMAAYIDALVPGSYVVFSHFYDPETTEHSELAKRIQAALLASPMGSGWFRTRSQIERMLAGLELVDPGLVACVQWWPIGPRIRPIQPVQLCLIGAVARKL